MLKMKHNARARVPSTDMRKTRQKKGRSVCSTPANQISDVGSDMHIMDQLAPKGSEKMHSDETGVRHG